MMDEKQVVISVRNTDDLKKIFKDVLTEINKELIFEVLKNLPMYQEEVLTVDAAASFIKRSRQCVRIYEKENKLTGRYFEKKNPVFLKTDLIQCIRALPDYHHKKTG